MHCIELLTALLLLLNVILYIGFSLHKPQVYWLIVIILFLAILGGCIALIIRFIRRK